VSRTFSVVPTGLLSFSYDVLEGGAQVGSIVNRAAFLQVKGTLAAGGKEYFTRREGAFKASYLMETAEGGLIARAAKVMALAEKYEISFGERTMRLKKKPMAMKAAFIISSAAGDTGTIMQESLLSRRLLCEMDAVPTEIVLFLLWMALIIRKRDED
jgi:hypothetical protein